MAKENIKKQIEYQNIMNKINMITNDQTSKNITIEQVQQVVTENEKLKTQITYLENKLKQLINEKVQEKMQEKLKAQNVQEKI